MDRPQSLFDSLDHLDELVGISTLAIHQKLYVSVNHSINWFAKHWFISLIGFSILASVIYRYLTFHGPTRLSKGVLPTYRPVDSHKD